MTEGKPARLNGGETRRVRNLDLLVPLRSLCGKIQGRNKCTSGGWKCPDGGGGPCGSLCDDTAPPVDRDGII